jgi:signal transduction histidine kinase/DNA-binding response OmpR family regulator
MLSIFQKCIDLGQHPADSKEERLRKSSLLVMSWPFALAGLVWGVLYFANDLIVPGLIPFTYGLLSLASIAHFSVTTRYTFFRNSQLFLILILPFMLQTSLGGFVPGSAVIIWAVIAPAGALIFHSISRSLLWFAAYALLVFTAFLINDRLPEYVNWDLNEDFIHVLFLMNILGVSMLVFVIQYYFVGKITELKEHIQEKNQTLEVQSEKLKEMDKIKSSFFANISHEFRTPLTLILGLTNKQIANPASPPDPKDSDTVKRNAQRLLQLINQLLDLSKLESGELKLDVSKNDIVPFLKTLTAQFESFAFDKQIIMTFNGHSLRDEFSSDPIELFFDQEKLQKVIINLLSNAVKFTPQGGMIEVEATTDETDAEPEVVKIKISNTGEGIPKESLPFVFQRFYQVDGSSNRRYEGTGIGLALVKELIELHHGSVYAESNEAITCFTVELPMNAESLRDHKVHDGIISETIGTKIDAGSDIAIARPVATNNIIEETEISNVFGDHDRFEILIVEDNPDLRLFMKTILQRLYKVTEAVDGQDGLVKANSTIPDLIISDIMMPRMDGFDLCKHLKSDVKTDHIPLIMLTAKASRENKLEGLGAGADDYLIKPFDEEELNIRVKNLIAIRERLQKKFQGEIMLKPIAANAVSVHERFLKKIKEAIEKNIDNERFGVDDLAGEMAMSRSQVHRKLKALTGQSATMYIRNYRLHRGAELLKQGAGNVTEIAYQVGFNSATYFSSCFHALFGYTPSRYQQGAANKRT